MTYDGLQKSYLWLVLEDMTATDQIVTWLYFGCLATGLHLRLVAASCHHMAMICNRFWQKMTKKKHQLDMLDSFNDHMNYFLKNMVTRFMTITKTAVKSSPVLWCLDLRLQWLRAKIPGSLVVVRQGLTISCILIRVLPFLPFFPLHWMQKYNQEFRSREYNLEKVGMFGLAK